LTDHSVHIVFVVEGYTEAAFVDRLLVPYLCSRGLSAHPATIVGKTKALKLGQTQRGGGFFSDWLKDLKRITANPNPAFRFTTLFDLYGLPPDFPDQELRTSDRSQANRCDRLERAMAIRINDRRFIPYLQLHEFEALVMACLPKLEELYDESTQLNGLARLQSEVASLCPEDINDSPVTAPSKRLLRRIPGYSKCQDGPDAIELAGLDHVRSRCPRFNNWLSRLESQIS
jgi:hypothetical protein